MCVSWRWYQYFYIIADLIKVFLSNLHFYVTSNFKVMSEHPSVDTIENMTLLFYFAAVSGKNPIQIYLITLHISYT